MLYEYKCKDCGAVFEAVTTIEERHSQPCPQCKQPAKKTMGGASSDYNFKPGVYNNIAPVPVYIESREQFTRVANMMGNYANRPFTKRENSYVPQALTKKYKREVLKRLKRGEY